MECIAVIAVSAAVIFARLAMMQDLNPLLWGVLAVVVYAGPPVYMIRRGAGWIDAPWVWISSFVGLFLLFVIQSVVAERRRYQGRGGRVDKAGNRKRGPKRKGSGG
jgi:hypothetical protein